MLYSHWMSWARGKELCTDASLPHINGLCCCVVISQSCPQTDSLYHSDPPTRHLLHLWITYLIPLLNSPTNNTKQNKCVSSFADIVFNWLHWHRECLILHVLQIQCGFPWGPTFSLLYANPFALFPHLILAELICVFSVSVCPKITLIHHRLTRRCAPLHSSFPVCPYEPGNKQRHQTRIKTEELDWWGFFIFPWLIGGLSVELHSSLSLGCCWLMVLIHAFHIETFRLLLWISRKHFQ